MITSSIGTLRMDKPFNPILGETYQATIYGCPLYAQQISHHPPISALYFLGRGYKLNGTFELKVDLGINTANGKNEGTLYVDFDNAVT